MMSVPFLENRLYNSFNESAMRISEGDFVKADYFLDCSYFQYYQRLNIYNDWATKENKRIKDAIGKAKRGSK